MGFVTSTLAMKKCVQIAKKNGAIAGIYNSNHFGMAANYLEIAAKNNCIAWIFTSSSPALPPHGAMAHISAPLHLLLGHQQQTKINHLY